MVAKKHKWTLGEFVDSARDHIGSIINNVGVRDIVYITCWISGTILIYNSVSGIKKIVLAPFVSKGISSIGRSGITFDESASLDDIDWNIFMLSMIGAYGLLKIDVSDVNAAISKLQSAITIAGAAIKL